MHNPTKHPLLRASAAALFLGAAGFALGQTASPNADKDKTITLPQFTVTESAANPYRANSAISASRVAMPIQDIPQSVSVVTSELIQDSLSQRMIDVAKYVTPVVESSLTMGTDRYQIRGFQVSHEFIDGVEISGQDGYSMSLAPYNIERIEIIKGPNAILVPGGSPGGQFNPITKSPTMKNKSSTTLELAQYFGTGVSTDINRIISEKNGLAGRVVAAYWRNDGYARNQYRNGYMVAPSFLWQIAPDTKLIVKAEAVQNRETNFSGLPIDPSVGSYDNARIAPGLPRDWSFGNDADTRHRHTERLSAELHTKLGDNITSRLYVMADSVVRSDVGGTNASIIGLAGGTGGSRNPTTGYYVPGTIYSVDNSGATAVVTSTTSTLPASSTYVYNRSYGRVYLQYTEAHIKDDYAFHFEGSGIKSNTIAGFSANTSKVHFISYPNASRATVAGNNLTAITYEDYVWQAPTASNGGTNKTGEQKDAQFFVYENASFWQDRIQASAGLSRFWGKLERTDSTGIGSNAYPEFSQTVWAKTFGLVYKPTKEYSIFAGYNTTGGQMPGSLSAGTISPTTRVAEGYQKEAGIKANLLDNTLSASVSYFDISQKNYPAPNSEYYLLVSQGITPPADFPSTLYLDLTSKGWEFEFNYAPSKNVTILGNYARFKLRQPFGIRYRATPDANGGLYVDYRFTEGTLKGFGVNVGFDYKGQAPGDQVNPGFTTTKPLPGGVGFVPNQPSFMVAGRLLTNLGFSYRAKDWTARLQIANVFDKEYIQAALNRNSLFVGDPRNVKASISYNF